jgi:hypothetical protein
MGILKRAGLDDHDVIVPDGARDEEIQRIIVKRPEHRQNLG